MQDTVKPIEFMFGGGVVKVELNPKQVVVHFFGTRFDYSATKAALRTRVETEVRKAGFWPQMARILAKGRK